MLLARHPSISRYQNPTLGQSLASLKQTLLLGVLCAHNTNLDIRIKYSNSHCSILVSGPKKYILYIKKLVGVAVAVLAVRSCGGTKLGPDRTRSVIPLSVERQDLDRSQPLVGDPAAATTSVFPTPPAGTKRGVNISPSFPLFRSPPPPIPNSSSSSSSGFRIQHAAQVSPRSTPFPPSPSPSPSADPDLSTPRALRSLCPLSGVDLPHASA